MQRPPWLQELRDLLAITSYESRQQALMRWERRWLVDLHALQVLDPELVEDSSRGVVEWARQHVQRMLGHELGKHMVELTTTVDAPHGAGLHRYDIRGEVIAIRREPKIDD
jgi:hypothetical protein